MVHVHQGKTHVASPLKIIVYGSKRKKKLNHGGRLPPGLCSNKVPCFEPGFGV